MLIVVITGDSSGQLVVTGDAEKVQIIGKKYAQFIFILTLYCNMFKFQTL